MLSDHDFYLLLNLVPGVRSGHVRRLLEHFGTPAAVAQAAAGSLQQVPRLSPRLAEQIAAILRQPQRLREEQALARQAGAVIRTLADDAYPAALRNLPDPPIVLYIRGSLGPPESRAVALVGARQASLYGLQCARQLAYDLALRGVAVVSGLARGIDAAAHEGALQARGRTWAVLGSGLGCLYPAEHRGLADRVAAEGAVISEYPMQTPPEPWRFPQRNRLISGLSQGVVVVEAASRSGALITADCALEQGREVFAVPGPITQAASQGTNRLLKQGARLVTVVDDIMEELGWQPLAGGGPVARETLPSQESSPQASRLLAVLAAAGAPDLNALVAATGLSVGEAASGLLELELAGRVRQLPGNRYERA